MVLAAHPPTHPPTQIVTVPTLGRRRSRSVPTVLARMRPKQGGRREKKKKGKRRRLHKANNGSSLAPPPTKKEETYRNYPHPLPRRYFGSMRVEAAHVAVDISDAILPPSRRLVTARAAPTERDEKSESPAFYSLPSSLSRCALPFTSSLQSCAKPFVVTRI